GREPLRQLLEPAERAGRLRQLRLTQRRGGAGLEVGAGQMGHQRADLVEARRRFWHGFPWCGVALGVATKPDMVRCGYGELMDARRGIFADFLLATAVLTRLPVGLAAPEQGAVAAACWAFPLVGAGVGFIAAIVFFAVGVAGLGALPSALLAVLAGAAATGALHED